MAEIVHLRCIGSKSKIREVPKFFRGPVKEFLDHSTEQGARALAYRIQCLWHSLGHTVVKCWVEQLPGRKAQAAMYVVRSNLVGGLPPKKSKEKS